MISSPHFISRNIKSVAMGSYAVCHIGSNFVPVIVYWSTAYSFITFLGPHILLILILADFRPFNNS
jgi:hypothetical protein